MNKVEKTRTIELPLSQYTLATSGEPIYFQNYSFLNDKQIVNIRTFTDQDYHVAGGTVITFLEIRKLVLTMLFRDNFRPIENLSCSRLCTFPATLSKQSKYMGLDITGRFYFDKSFITILGVPDIALQAKILPIQFTYID